MSALTEYFVPQWISTLFLIVIPIPIILIALLARKGAPIEKKTKVFYTIIGFFALYFTCITLGSFNGLFNKVFFPPIILLYTTTVRTNNIQKRLVKF